MTTEKKVVVGSGSYGEIYYLSNNPYIVYKRTRDVCDNLKLEYQHWNQAYQKYIQYTSTKKDIRDFARILRPSHWKINHTGCVFQMARIFPMSGKYTWQAYIGDTENPNLDKIVTSDDKIRGRYMGPKTLSKYTNVNKLAYAVGTLMGIVQYGARLNGLDVEFVVGYDNGRDDLKLFLIDFDQTKKWTIPKNKKEEKILISNLEWSLSAEPYFPGADSEYHKEFVRGYYEVAGHYGFLDLAKKVIDQMNEFYKISV